MKKYLRLPAGLCLDRGRPAISIQPSELGCQQSALSNQLRAKHWLIPKTYYLIPILLLVFVSCSAVLAQELVGNTAPAAQAENKAIDLTSLGIQIGEKVPDVTINNIHNYKTSTAKLSDFKGKLLILDFWATWCAPCVAMIPKMDSLQKVFGDKIQFLSVTYQKEGEVLPFLKKLEKKDDRKYNLPIVLEDNVLRKIFAHRTLPHYVWISATGEMVAATGLEDISDQKIIAVSENGKIEFDQKIENPLDYNRDLLLVDQGIKNYKETLQGFSSFNKYIEGLPSRFTTYLDTVQGFKASYMNVDAATLFKFAYHDFGPFDNKRIIIDVKDRNKVTTDLKGALARDWWSKNAYCYELYFPYKTGISRKEFYEYMQDDLKRYLPMYSCSVEKRKIKSYALVRTSSRSPFASKVQIPVVGTKTVNDEGYTSSNLNFSHFIYPLSSYYLQLAEFPIIDDTHYTGNVDLDIKADMRDIDSINKALAEYDLKFVIKEVEVDVLVIKDSVNPVP